MMRRLPARTAALLGLAATATACGPDPVSPPPTAANVVGTYALASINGHAMPAPFGTGTTLVYDSLTFAADGTWREATAGGTLTDATPRDRGVYSGTWSFDSASATVRDSYQPPRGGLITQVYRVGARAATLSYDAGPVKPASPGGGLWVFKRVP